MEERVKVQLECRTEHNSEIKLQEGRWLAPYMTTSFPPLSSSLSLYISFSLNQLPFVFCHSSYHTKLALFISSPQSEDCLSLSFPTSLTLNITYLWQQPALWSHTIPTPFLNTTLQLPPTMEIEFGTYGPTSRQPC